MTPLQATNAIENEKYMYVDQNVCEDLYQKLQSGIQCVKNGEVYTIEKAWEEIDKI